MTNFLLKHAKNNVKFFLHVSTPRNLFSKNFFNFKSFGAG